MIVLQNHGMITATNMRADILINLQSMSMLIGTGYDINMFNKSVAEYGKYEGLQYFFAQNKYPCLSVEYIIYLQNTLNRELVDDRIAAEYVLYKAYIERRLHELFNPLNI